MKKYIICLILAISWSLLASAQIQREFFGYKFGVCTETEFLNGLKSQNIVYKKLVIHEATSYIVKNSNLMFEGKKWPSISFTFVGGKFDNIEFRATEEDLPIDELKKRTIQLKEKYDAFFDKRSTYQTKKLLIMHFKDGKSYLKVQYGFNMFDEYIEMSAFFDSKHHPDLLE